MKLFGRKRTYLDWAASAPVSPRALMAFAKASRLTGNPSSPHEDGVRAREALEEARTSIARLSEVRPSGVVFTSGATEANNLALRGSVSPGDHVLYMPGSHASLIETVHALEHEGVSADPIPLKEGAIDLDGLRSLLRPETKIVAIDAVCGETGTRFATRAVRNVLDEFAKKGGIRPLLHVDASQAPLAVPFDLTRLAADTAALDAQKVGGMRGVGVLLKREHVKLTPILTGGGQEGGLRPGTEPVALACALAAALSEAHAGQEVFSKDARRMREDLVRALAQEFPDMTVNQGMDGVPHILNVSFPGRDTDYAVMLLDAAGFSVSTKSACETDSTAGSRAVLALTGDPARAGSTLRISWGPGTTPRALHRLVPALTRTIRFLDAASV